MTDGDGRPRHDAPLWLRAARARKMSWKTTTRVVDALRSAPVWQSRATARREVARALAGPTAQARRERILGGGTASLRIALYTVVDAEGAPFGPRFVEKISSDRAEGRVARALATGAGSCVLPRVLAVCAGPRGDAIYMDWWPEAEHVIGSDLPDPRVFARAVHRMSTDLAPLSQSGDLPRAPRYFRALGGRFQRHLHDRLGPGAPTLRAACAHLAEIPEVIGHNDLHAENVVPRRVAPGIDVGLIDIGSIGLNPAGVSLQRYALSAVTGGDPRLLQNAASEYASLSGIDRRQILFAANLYAASRRLNRNINKLEREPFEIPALLFDEALRTW